MELLMNFDKAAISVKVMEFLEININQEEDKKTLLNFWKATSWVNCIPSNKHSLIATKEQEVGISCGPTLLWGQFNNTLQVMVL